MKIKFPLIFLLVLLPVLFIGNNSVLALGGTFYANDPINYNCSNSNNYVWLFPDTSGSKTAGGFSCVQAGAFFYDRYGNTAVHYFVMEKTHYNCGNLTWNDCLSTGGGDPIATFEFQYYPTLAPTPPPTIATTNLPVADLNSAYSQTLQALGGTPPYIWSVVSGNLPTGLTLNSLTGEISGIPTESYDYNFTVQVTDTNSQTATPQALSISVNPPRITTATLLSANISESYSQILEVGGGVASYNWSLFRGNLPPGLSLNGSTGAISGTPTTAGVYAFIVQVQDDHLRITTRDLILRVKPFTGGGTFYADDPISYSCSDSNNYVWVFTDTSGSKSVGGFSCVQSGSFFYDRYGNTAVHYFVMEKVHYNCGNLTWHECSITGGGDPIATFEFQYYPTLVPSITTTSLPDATVGTIYSQILQVTGSGPFGWSTVSGSLPSDLSLNSATGEISGTPTTVVTASFTVQATDVNNRAVTKNLGIIVHGNTSTGSNVQVTSGSTTLTFSNVTQEGQTTVTQSSSGSQPPSGFKLGNPPTYYNISTTAQFIAPVEACINYNDTQFRNENNLKLMHFENGQWINVTISLDTVNNIICGSVSSFSEFALVEELTIEYIAAEIKDFHPDIKTEDKLLKRLDQAQRALSKGHSRQAIKSLKLFSKLVDKEKGKTITNEQANILLVDANGLIKILGGGSLLSTIRLILADLWGRLLGTIFFVFK